MHLHHCFPLPVCTIINVIVASPGITPATNVLDWTSVRGISIEAHPAAGVPKLKVSFNALGLNIDSTQIFMTDDTCMELQKDAMTRLKPSIRAQIKQLTNQTGNCDNSDQIGKLINNNLPLNYKRNNCTLPLRELKALSDLFDLTVQAKQGIAVLYIGFQSVHFDQQSEYFDITNWLAISDTDFPNNPTIRPVHDPNIAVDSCIIKLTEAVSNLGAEMTKLVGAAGGSSTTDSGTIAPLTPYFNYNALPASAQLKDDNCNNPKHLMTLVEL